MDINSMECQSICKPQSEPKVLYAEEAPYPPVCVSSPNQIYGWAMQDNMGGRSSEMSAVSLYFYNHLVTGAYEEIALCFHKISIVEMHHLEIFGELSLQLGMDPILWTKQNRRHVFWTPAYNKYCHNLELLLQNSISAEEKAISKYKQQCSTIKDICIVKNLERIIIDEELHVTVLQSLLEKYCGHILPK